MSYLSVSRLLMCVGKYLSQGGSGFLTRAVVVVVVVVVGVGVAVLGVPSRRVPGFAAPSGVAARTNGAPSGVAARAGVHCWVG